MLSVTSRLHAHLLTKELERVRASYNHSCHYGVGYDRYHKLTYVIILAYFSGPQDSLREHTLHILLAKKNHYLVSL